LRQPFAETILADERYRRTEAVLNIDRAPPWRVTFRRIGPMFTALAATVPLLKTPDTPITILEATLA